MRFNMKIAQEKAGKKNRKGGCEIYPSDRSFKPEPCLINMNFYGTAH